MHAKLAIKKDKLILTWAEQSAEIALSVADLQAQFTPYPPSEMVWEAAIMQVEDAISPYRDALADYSTLALYHAVPLQAITDSNGQISAADFERAFAVLAGYRPSRDFPELTHNAETAALILILREWVHHLGFDIVQLMD